MKKKINFSFFIFFNLTIIYFIFIVSQRMMSFNSKVFIKLVTLIGIAIILNFIVILFSKKELSVIKKFLVISIFIGSSSFIIFPLLRGIDETGHFSRIYSFFLDSKITSEGDYKLPKDILETYSNYTDSHLGRIIDNNVLVESNILKGARLYTPLSYLPYLLPVWILGFLIKTNIVTIITVSRLCGFLVYLGSSLYAIKTISKRKEFMALFCLIPAVVMSSCTITADLLTNCSIIVFIATWYKLYYEKKVITLKEIIIILISGILAGFAKMVYALEFLLIFFLPNECFSGNKKRKIKIISIVAIVICLFTLINVSITVNTVNDTYKDFQLQKEFVMNNPFKFLIILFMNILNNYRFFFTFTTNYTILTDIYNPEQFLQLLYMIVLLVCIYKEEADLKLSKFKIFSIFFIGFLMIALMFTWLYLQFTPWLIGKIGGNEIEGMQSRYYIPVMLMFLTCLPSKKIVFNLDDNFLWYIALWIDIDILLEILLCVM